jgi:beta-lactamase class D
MHRSVCFALGFWMLACGSASAPTRAPAATPAGAAHTLATEAPGSAASGPSIKELPELVREFEAEGTTGTIALFDSREGVLGCSDVKRCQRAFIPASTFKIPNSMIALETGSVEGPDTVMKWDGKQYWVDAWHQDLKFRDAFRVSCVPCYQAIARQVGDKVEQEWVTKLDYGNHDTSGGVDRFWLWGGLRISPVQQIDFLRRFDGNKLPISERTADIVRDIMTLDVTETYVLRAKTGAAQSPEDKVELGWFVGWLELGERRVFFATLIDGHRSDVDLLPMRRRVTERVLKARGLM